MTIPRESTIPRVLLVDDETLQLQLRTSIMESCGFSVVAANCPVAASSEIEAGTLDRTDIAILDYNMPGMTGSELARRLRAKYPCLKIILHSGAVDIPQSDLMNVDAFVSKADGVASLIAQVMQFLEDKTEIQFSLTSGAA